LTFTDLERIEDAAPTIIKGQALRTLVWQHFCWQAFYACSDQIGDFNQWVVQYGHVGIRAPPLQRREDMQRLIEYPLLVTKYPVGEGSFVVDPTWNVNFSDSNYAASADPRRSPFFSNEVSMALDGLGLSAEDLRQGWIPGSWSDFEHFSYRSV
jgi:hypothetical protein